MLAKLQFWKNDDKDKPEQYRIVVAESAPRSVVSVQDPSGAPDKTPNEREDPRAAQGPAQVSGRSSPMRFASLGSGSEGNGLVVEAGGTRVLIDCGFGVRDTVARLARSGVAPESLAAILVTHEHNDHVGGVPAFAARYDIPVWLTFGTLAAVAGALRRHGARLRLRQPRPFRDRRPRGAAVSGAARRARAGAVRRARRRVPAGRAHRHRRSRRRTSKRACPAATRWCSNAITISTCSPSGDYPLSLKQRIAGRFGHLHNEAAAALLARARHSRGCSTSSPRTCRQQNNTPDQARAQRSPALGCAPTGSASPTRREGFGWREFGS